MIKRTDYLKHAIVGVILADYFYDFGLYPTIIAVVLAALGKDVIWDRLLKKGTFEWKDIICTLGGGVVGLCIRVTKEFIISCLFGN